jgi:hypothetical protein
MYTFWVPEDARWSKGPAPQDERRSGLNKALGDLEDENKDAWLKAAEKIFEFLTTRTRPSTTGYGRGDIVLVSLFFTDR